MTDKTVVQVEFFEQATLKALKTQINNFLSDGKRIKKQHFLSILSEEGTPVYVVMVEYIIWSPPTKE